MDNPNDPFPFEITDAPADPPPGGTPTGPAAEPSNWAPPPLPDVPLEALPLPPLSDVPLEALPLPPLSDVPLEALPFRDETPSGRSLYALPPPPTEPSLEVPLIAIPMDDPPPPPRSATTAPPKRTAAPLPPAPPPAKPTFVSPQPPTSANHPPPRPPARGVTTGPRSNAPRPPKGAAPAPTTKKPRVTSTGDDVRQPKAPPVRKGGRGPADVPKYTQMPEPPLPTQLRGQSHHVTHLPPEEAVEEVQESFVTELAPKPEPKSHKTLLLVLVLAPLLIGAGVVGGLVVLGQMHLTPTNDTGLVKDKDNGGVKDKDNGSVKDKDKKIDPSNLVVANDDSADYKKLEEALRAAQPNATIHIKPGTYTESLILNKDIHLVGDGPSGSITLIGKDGPCLTVSCNSGKVENLTLQAPGGPAGPDGTPFPAVSITQGKLLLQNCDVSAPPSAMCVVVSGVSATPTLDKCDLHGGRRGLLIHQGAKPQVSGGSIHDNIIGVEVDDAGGSLLQGCTLKNNQNIDLYVRNNGDPHLDNCTVSGGGEGVVADQNSRPELNDCQIDGQEHEAVVVEKDAESTLRSCRIYNGRGQGVLVKENGKATLVLCQIHDWTDDGVWVDTGHVTLQECQIFKNGAAGVMVKKKGGADLDRCLIYDHSAAAAVAVDDGSAVLKGCRFHDNHGKSLRVGKGSTVDASDCQKSELPVADIQLDDGLKDFKKPAR